MAIPALYSEKYFFHFTHIKNLDSILKNGLLSTNEKKKLGLPHVDVASEEIQLRRSSMDVTCGQKGKVHDYVPFYFTSICPMFLAVVNSKNYDQQDFIFLAFSIEKLEKLNGLFTDAAANSIQPPNFYSSPLDLDKLDWAVINKTAWGYPDEIKHRKMAEVLIYDKVPSQEIDSIVVWNENIEKRVLKIYERNTIVAPKVSYTPFKGKYHFHFTKFFFEGRDCESVITGPKALKSEFRKIINEIFEQRKDSTIDNFTFKNIHDAIKGIQANFCIINELQGIFELETSNEVHSECVSDHTKTVVTSLKEGPYYESFESTDKDILELSCYLHDIGKGPKSKWKNGIQSLYPDHPFDAIPMLKRILTEEFKNISMYEIRKICLLVIYHDLVGEILMKGRNIQQIIDIIEDELELNLLIAINFADVSAIDLTWQRKIKAAIPNFKKDVLGKLI